MSRSIISSTLTYCTNIFRYTRNFLTPTSFSYISKFVTVQQSCPHSVQFVRFKSIRKRPQSGKHNSPEDSDSDKEPESDLSDSESEVTGLPTDRWFSEDARIEVPHKDIEVSVPSLRFDRVIARGLGISSSSVVKEFYKNRCRLNGAPLKRKSASVGLGDLLDLTSTTDATGEAQSARSARRVRVLTVHEQPSGSARTKLRVWRSPIPLNS